MLFKDRQEAGRRLAEKLKKFSHHPDAIILALPRGGVVIGFEMAEALNLPLDVVVTRKIGAPGNPEFAIGAIDEKGKGVFNQEVIAMYGISQAYIHQEVKKETAEAKRRLKIYRAGRPALNLKDKTAILADDGLATGLTMLAAIRSVRAKGAQFIIAAVPVAAEDSLRRVKKEVDEAVCLAAPSNFQAVGEFYERFNQTSDREVIEKLHKHLR